MCCLTLINHQRESVLSDTYHLSQRKCAVCHLSILTGWVCCLTLINHHRESVRSATYQSSQRKCAVWHLFIITVKLCFLTLISHHRECVVSDTYLSLQRNCAFWHLSIITEKVCFLTIINHYREIVLSDTYQSLQRNCAFWHLSINTEKLCFLTHSLLITSAPCHGSVMNFTGKRLFVLRTFSFHLFLIFDFVFIHFPVVLFNSLVAFLKRVNGQFFSFSSPENVEKVWGLLQRKTGLNPNVFHWPYQGGNSTFFWRSPFK